MNHLDTPSGHGGARPNSGRPRGKKKLPQDGVTFEEARRRKELALAELREIEVAERRAVLLPADEVSAAWADQVAIAKSRLMALPTRLAPDLMQAKDMLAIEAIIRASIIEVMEELSASRD